VSSVRLSSKSAWVGWSFDWPAEPGEHEVCCRATDANGQIQPASSQWNLDGLCNNAVQRVPVVVLGSAPDSGT
jgi:sulfane dehydrogenase subunit SoxC